LNGSCGLRNIIQTLSLKNQFILDIGGNGDGDTFMQLHSPDKLFAQKVADFNGLAVATIRIENLGIGYSMTLTLMGKWA
jgi:hypothetical protein